MSYRTLQAQCIINREVLNEREASEYLAQMKYEMVHQVAEALVTEGFGKIDEHYSIERLGNVYTFQVRIMEEDLL